MHAGALRSQPPTAISDPPILLLHILYEIIALLFFAKGIALVIQLLSLNSSSHSTKSIYKTATTTNKTPSSLTFPKPEITHSRSSTPSTTLDTKRTRLSRRLSTGDAIHTLLDKKSPRSNSKNRHIGPEKKKGKNITSKLVLIAIIYPALVYHFVWLSTLGPVWSVVAILLLAGIQHK